MLAMITSIGCELDMRRARLFLGSTISCKLCRLHYAVWVNVFPKVVSFGSPKHSHKVGLGVSINFWQYFWGQNAKFLPFLGSFWQHCCLSSPISTVWLALDNVSDEPLTIGPAEICFWRSHYLRFKKKTFQKLQLKFFTVSPNAELNFLPCANHLFGVFL